MMSLGQGTLSTTGGVTSATFTTSALTGGDHAIIASYGGDSKFFNSTGMLTQTVYSISTSTAVASQARTRPPDDEPKGHDLIIMGDISWQPAERVL